jgi:hypothetical protein
VERTVRRTEGGIAYRDLNKNGRLDPYEDPRRPVEERVADLLGRMALEEKAGLLFHTIIAAGADGRLVERPERFSREPTSELVATRLLSHFNVHALPEPRQAAEWHNRLQALAEGTRLGIPVTISSDPRHAFSNNPLTACARAGSRSGRSSSGWPRSVTRRWWRRSPTSRGGSTSRWVSGWRCTRWPTSAPSRAGRASTAPSARTPHCRRG